MTLFETRYLERVIYASDGRCYNDRVFYLRVCGEVSFRRLVQGCVQIPCLASAAAALRGTVVSSLCSAENTGTYVTNWKTKLIFQTLNTGKTDIVKQLEQLNKTR